MHWLKLQPSFNYTFRARGENTSLLDACIFVANVPKFVFTFEAYSEGSSIVWTTELLSLFSKG